MQNGVGSASDSSRSIVPALAFRNLSKTFGGVHALKRVDLTVHSGEVHGLLGQNGSGKSTLIKILAGYHEPDPGAELRVHGQEVRLPVRPGQFREHGISFVHQDLGLIPELTATENLYMGMLESRPPWWIRETHLMRDAGDLFAQYGVDIDPRLAVESLTPVQRALLAIVRAMEEIRQTRDRDDQKSLLVLDEPTPFLPRHDVEKLFELVRAIVVRGASVVFVSHDVDEVLEITDRATVLRDGELVDTLETDNVSREALIESIVGRKVSNERASIGQVLGRPVSIQLRGLTGGRCHDVSLDLHKGEIVGLTGLIGSGYEEALYLIYGATHVERGAINLAGRPIDLRTQTPRQAIQHGMVLVPADRNQAGAVGELSVLDNLSLPNLGEMAQGLWINWRKHASVAKGLAERFDVRPPRPELEFKALSGGNQQKVLLAKWLQTNPRLVLLDEPTQGVDVGARQQVFEVVRGAAREGATVLCASSDYEQLAVLCHRVVIFNRGRVATQLMGPQLSKDAIAEACYQSVSASDIPGDTAAHPSVRGDEGAWQ